MLNACQELVQLIQSQGRKWQKAVQVERDARVRMERMCEQVASQSAKLEKQIQRASRKDRSTNARTINEESASSEEDDEFHDAESVFRIPYVFSKCIDLFFFSYDLNLRLQQHLSSSDKQSTKLVDDNASSCDEDNAESESEEQDDENLPVVIVKSSFLFVTRKLSFGNYEFRIKIKRYDS